ncbi:MAG: hypothetical protein AAFZ80_01590 [Cyanobacteria bacterium P01_A01_bin.105]
MSLSPVQVVEIVEALPVFQQMCGDPESELDLRARVGALLAVMDGVELLPGETEPLIDDVLRAFQVRTHPGMSRWVTAARTWLSQQADQLTQVVSAYVQEFASPALVKKLAQKIDDRELTAVVSTAVAVVGSVSDGQLSPSEGRQLARQAIHAFNLDEALSRVVPAGMVTLARRVAQYRHKADFEADVLSIAQAYLQKFGGILTPALMTRVIRQGTLNLSPERLLSGGLDNPGDLNQMARVFTFKMQLLDADPPVTKTAQAIAQQVHDSVTEFNRGHRALDLTEPNPNGTLSVSSVLQPQEPDEELSWGL